MKLKYLRLAELFVWLLIILTASSLFFYNRYLKDSAQDTYYVFFDDVEGIIKGSNVRLMGIDIGYVKDVKIFDNKVFLSFVVKKKNLEIPKCATATIEFYGLGGSVSLELNPITSSENEDGIKEIIASKSYRVQDLWDGSALVARVLTDIYGSVGRLTTNDDINKIKPYVKQSKLIKTVSDKTLDANESQIVIINKLTRDTEKYLKEKSKEISSDTEETDEIE